MGGATLLAVGGAAVALWEPGLRDGRLGTPGRQVLGPLARAFFDGVLPSGPVDQAVALQGFFARVDALVAALPPHARKELSQLLALLATGAGRRTLVGLAVPWPDATVPQLQAALQGMRLSSLALRRQAYLALHEITGAAYFADDATWSVLGYPGPLPI